MSRLVDVYIRQSLNIFACFCIALAMLVGVALASAGVQSNSIENTIVTPYLKSPFWRFRLGYHDMFARQLLYTLELKNKQPYIDHNKINKVGALHDCI